MTFYANADCSLKPGAIIRLDPFGVLRITRRPDGGLVIGPRTVLPIRGCGNDPKLFLDSNWSPR